MSSDVEFQIDVDQVKQDILDFALVPRDEFIANQKLAINKIKQVNELEDKIHELIKEVFDLGFAISPSQEETMLSDISFGPIHKRKYDLEVLTHSKYVRVKLREYLRNLDNEIVEKEKI